MKIALDAGHGLHTNGKETIQKVPTKEWLLNDRVADHIQLLLKDYDVEILRVDNDEGENDESLPERTGAANEWGADLYLSIHHNAFKPNVGTGVAVFRSVNDKTKLGELIVTKMSENTGLANRGCKTRQLTDGRDYYHVIRESKMQSFLVEGGFMTNWTDLEVITTMAGAKKYAKAVVDALIEYFNLIKKVQPKEYILVGKLDKDYPKGVNLLLENGKKDDEIYVVKGAK